MRLQKYMADCGVASRWASETYIKEGRVKVNGRTVTEMGVQVNPDRDVVSVDGKRIRPPQSHGYYAFYKPRSVASTCQDDRDRKTVLDYFKNVDRRLLPSSFWRGETAKYAGCWRLRDIGSCGSGGNASAVSAWGT